MPQPPNSSPVASNPGHVDLEDSYIAAVPGEDGVDDDDDGGDIEDLSELADQEGAALLPSSAAKSGERRPQDRVAAPRQTWCWRACCGRVVFYLSVVTLSALLTALVLIYGGVSKSRFLCQPSVLDAAGPLHPSEPAAPAPEVPKLWMPMNITVLEDATCAPSFGYTPGDGGPTDLPAATDILAEGKDTVRLIQVADANGRLWAWTEWCYDFGFLVVDGKNTSAADHEWQVYAWQQDALLFTELSPFDPHQPAVLCLRFRPVFSGLPVRAFFYLWKGNFAAKFHQTDANLRRSVSVPSLSTLSTGAITQVGLDRKMSRRPICPPSLTSFEQPVLRGDWVHLAYNATAPACNCDGRFCVGKLDTLDTNRWIFVPHTCRMRYFSVLETRSCLASRNILLVGDSNSEMIGRQFTDMTQREYPLPKDFPRSYDIRSPNYWISAVFNGAPSDGGDCVGMTAYRDATLVNRHRKFFQNPEDCPDVVFVNTGIHDICSKIPLAQVKKNLHEVAGPTWLQLERETACAGMSKFVWRTTLYEGDLPFAHETLQHEPMLNAWALSSGASKTWGHLDFLYMSQHWRFSSAHTDGMHYGRRPGFRTVKYDFVGRVSNQMHLNMIC